MGANNLLGIPYSNNRWVEGITYNLIKDMPIGGAGFGVTTNYIISGYRFGDRLIARGQFLTGTVAASVGWINLPSGLTINSKLYPNLFSTGTGIVGSYLDDTATTNDYSVSNLAGAVFWDGSDTTKLFFAFRSEFNGASKDTGNAIFSSGDGPSFCFDIPIAQWAP